MQNSLSSGQLQQEDSYYKSIFIFITELHVL